MKSKHTVPLVNTSAEDGYVERQAIRNQFSTFRRKIEETLPTSERWPVRDMVLEMMDAMQFKILSHSKSAEEILYASPILKRPTDHVVIDQKDAHEARLLAMRNRHQ